MSSYNSYSYTILNMLYRIEVCVLRGPGHTANIVLFQKIINNLRSEKVRTCNSLEKPHMDITVLIITHDASSLQRYVVTLPTSYMCSGVRVPNMMPYQARIPLPKMFDFNYVEGTIEGSKFSPDDYSSRIILCSESRLS